MKLIVSAWLPEQAFLREQGLPPHEVAFLLTGVGPLKASVQIALALERGRMDNRPIRSVSFVGTAGTYDVARCPLLSAHRVTRAVFSDVGAAVGQSYFPAATLSSGLTFVSPSEASSGQRGEVCVCPPSVTRDAHAAAALAAFGALENLELAGLAEACVPFGVEWDAFLGVSNAVGPASHAEWKASHEAASLAAQRLLLEASAFGKG